MYVLVTGALGILGKFNFKNDLYQKREKKYLSMIN